MNKQRSSSSQHLRLYKVTIFNTKRPEQEFAIYNWLPSPMSLEQVTKYFKEELETPKSGYLVKSIERVTLAEESLALSSRPSKTEGSFLTLWKIKGNSLLKNLARSILTIDATRTVAFFDYRGKLVHREVRNGLGTGFETDSIGLGGVASRGLGLFRAALLSDSELGKTQFLVVGREGFKAIFVSIPELKLIARIAIERNAEASEVYDHIAPLMSNYLSSDASSST